MTTRLADIIIPEVFTPYTNKKTMELSALFQSGIVVNDTSMNTLASAAATHVSMPFFGDLTGDAETVIEDADLTPGGISALQDVATIVRRARMWGSTDLAAALSGANPASIIGDLVASYWAREHQKELIAVLGGVFGAASMSGLVADISGGAGAAAVWSGSAFVDACQKLGDAKENLNAIAVHSATESLLRKQDMIEYIPNSQGGMPIPYYQGKRLIVDDGCPVSAGVYTSYIFGAGALAFGNGSPAGFVPTEVARVATKGSGIDYLISRKTFILHPRGVKWLGGTVANAESATRAELATASNWVRVYDPKQLRIVAFKHKLA